MLAFDRAIESIDPAIKGTCCPRQPIMHHHLAAAHQRDVRLLAALQPPEHLIDDAIGEQAVVKFCEVAALIGPCAHAAHGLEYVIERHDGAKPAPVRP
jgi:hypothetical protein